jgi:hypothetical protein
MMARPYVKPRELDEKSDEKLLAVYEGVVAMKKHDGLSGVSRHANAGGWGCV